MASSRESSAKKNKKGVSGFYRNYLVRAYDAVSHKAADFFHNLKMTENLIMIILAIIIGALAGLGAVGIRALIKEISHFFFTGSGTLLENMANTPWYLKLMIPALGGLIVGPIIYLFSQEAKGTGVPEVMQSVLLKGGEIRPRVAFIKTIVSTITIGSGGSVGREGPIVQIGASIGSSIAQFFHISTNRMKTLVGCGAAAGIAAAFNAPVAGALFAVEIILMDYAVAKFSPIVISSVMATVISHAFEGDFPAMIVTGEHYLHSVWDISFYFILGILCGIASFIFIRTLFHFTNIWENRVNMPPYFKAAMGGVSIGIIALFFPQIMGVGYDSINLILLSEDMPYMGLGSGWVNSFLGGQAFWLMALLLVFMKTFSTSMTLGSGGSGGIFAPSLFIGTMLGAAFGFHIHQLFPGQTAAPGTYALIAMGGLVAGTTRAPITAIITVFELTKETSIILPLMITCIISTIMSGKFSTESIYTLKLMMKNINIKEGREIDIMKTLRVRDLYSKNFVSFPHDTDFNRIVTTLISRELPFVSVHHRSNGNYLGIISSHAIKDVMFEKETLKNLMIANDIVENDVPHIHLDQNCANVVKKMRESKFDVLPVLESKNHKRQIGIIWLQDIVDAYEREMEHMDITSNLAKKISLANIDTDVRFMEGYIITEIPAPSSFHGRSIRELQIRQKYGVDILSVKSTTKTGRLMTAIPQADYIIKKDDRLIVAGRADGINQLKILQ
ncbi:MAG: chloride channel protein [candidate division Zixibacteria bacterium]|nr:chloride channel protein [candidate division Zixibacteria bacterium]NIR66065.1 chloride channel protein [candidate division Zixibacteria bacterium]NIS17149.1 chloride channel protein [candidate division Zixibacteria bacterium]NIS47695.1 chloride channel protein [candidate division Zixibacteria bacterium]NIT53504.1 chloride channel protein [candidate division Zixibacteria bacterium]